MRTPKKSVRRERSSLNLSFTPEIKKSAEQIAKAMGYNNISATITTLLNEKAKELIASGRYPVEFFYPTENDSQNP